MDSHSKRRVLRSRLNIRAPMCEHGGQNCATDEPVTTTQEPIVKPELAAPKVACQGAGCNGQAITTRLHKSQRPWPATAAATARPLTTRRRKRLLPWRAAQMSAAKQLLERWSCSGGERADGASPATSPAAGAAALTADLVL
jgi:hypothetical protein